MAGVRIGSSPPSAGGGSVCAPGEVAVPVAGAPVEVEDVAAGVEDVVEGLGAGCDAVFLSSPQPLMTSVDISTNNAANFTIFRPFTD